MRKMSSQNVEAAEFQPAEDEEIDALMTEGYDALNTGTRACHGFPMGEAHASYQMEQAFRSVTQAMQARTVALANTLLRGDLPSQLRCDDDDESNLERLSEGNDAVLDRVSGAVEAEARGAPVQAGPAPAAWNRAPTLATVQVKTGGASLLGAKNITRPQLAFKEPVDNSERPFVPRIKEKPNALEPLVLSPIYSAEGDILGYEHPYKAELDQYSPPEWALTGEETGEAGAEAEPPLTMVETMEALDALVQHLDTVREIAVDLEHHSYRSYQGIACLVQISTDSGGDFIVDALALRDHLHVLNRAFTDPNKLKVFHGADQDVLWLQRDLGVYVVGLFDTHQAARLLRLPQASLKYLLKRYCGFDADKTYQLADWRMRPLPPELVAYARADTQHLLRVWRHMRAALRDATPAPLLVPAFRASQLIAITTYKKPVLTPQSHMGAYLRSGKRFCPARMAALREVWEWRDSHARALDESVGYLLPNHMLLAVIEALPRDLQGLRALCDPAPPFLLHNMHELHKIVHACRMAQEGAPQQPPAMLAVHAVGADAGGGLQHVRVTHDPYAALDHIWVRVPASFVAPDVYCFIVSPLVHYVCQKTGAMAFLPPYRLYYVRQHITLEKTGAMAFLPPYRLYYVRQHITLEDEQQQAVAHPPVAVMPAPTLAPLEVVSLKPAPVMNEEVPEPKEEVTEPKEEVPEPGEPPAEHEYRKPSPRKRRHGGNAAAPSPSPYARAQYSRLRTDKPEESRQRKHPRKHR